MQRTTRYSWNGILSEIFGFDVGVGQGSALFPILSALYLAPLLWHFDKEMLGATLMSYVDDGTIIVQSSTWKKNLLLLKEAYHVVFEITQAMGLVLEHDKSEVYHFSRKSNDHNPAVDLGYAPYTGDTPLTPKPFWRYLSFYFDQQLRFTEHTKRYSTKAFTSVMALLALGNSVRGLTPKTSGYSIGPALFLSLPMVRGCGTTKAFLIRRPCPI